MGPLLEKTETISVLSLFNNLKYSFHAIFVIDINNVEKIQEDGENTKTKSEQAQEKDLDSIGKDELPKDKQIDDEKEDKLLVKDSYQSQYPQGFPAAG